jgi:hypothetical protein
MRGPRRAGVDGGARLVERRAGMAERDANTDGDQPADEVEPARRFGSQRDDAHGRAGAVDRRQDLVAAHGTRRPAGRVAKVFERLRPAKLRIDERALDVRREHTGAAGLRSGHRPGDVVEEVGERRDWTGNRGRTERRHAPLRQHRRHAADGPVTVHHIGAGHAMHVRVDESRDDRAPGPSEHAVARPAGRIAGDHLGDARAVDDERPVALDAVRAYDRGAGQERPPHQ